MTIEDFLRLLLRNILLLVVGTLLAGAIGYAISYTKPAQYSADALGYVSASSQLDEDGNPITQASGNMEFQHQKAQSYLPLFHTRAVGQRIVDQLGLSASPDEVAGSLVVSLDPNAPIITVTAQAPTAQEASRIADAAIEATAVEAKSLESGGDSKAAVSVQLTTYQTAIVPGAPVSPDRRKYALAGAALGLLLALAIAWLRDRNDSRIRTAEDLAAVVDVPLLGTLPDSKEFARTKDGPLSEPQGFGAREAIRKLRTNLRYVDVDAPPRSIVVTSTAPAEGKSVVSANLARVMARAGQPTLLVEADLRRPVVAQEFGVDGSVGLAQVLASAADLEDAVLPSGTDLMDVLPSGQVPPNPSELLGSQRMKDLISELSSRWFVIIDAPPVLAVTDAQLLARHADGAILVTVPGRTRSVGLRRAVEALQGVRAKVYGVVMNRASTSRFTRLAYGDAEYGYAGYGDVAYGRRGYGGRYATAEAQTVAVDVAAVGGPERTREQAPAPEATPDRPVRRSGRRRAVEPSDAQGEP